MVYGATSAERCILYAGMQGGSLIEILNDWVTGEDAPYWNRKAAYVAQLIPAALSLLERELIEVWEEPAPAGEGSVMTSDRAAVALADPDKWWRYDPDGNWDPGEDLARHAELATGNTEPMTTIYSIITTQKGLEGGIALLLGQDT
jgi:hypothetical protein